MVVTKEVTVSSWVEGRLLLFIVQAKPDDADDQQTELKKSRIRYVHGLTPFAKASGRKRSSSPFKGDSRSALAAAFLGLFYHNPHNLTRLKSLRPALTRPEEEGIIKA